MKTRLSPPVRLLLILCYLVICTLAVGDLGIAWSKEFAVRDNLGYMVWNSVLDFEEPLTKENMPDEKLAGLVKKASEEMWADHKKKPWKPDISNKRAGEPPTMMAAFTRENKVYLSSSSPSCKKPQQGYAYNQAYAPEAVHRALYQCQVHSPGGQNHLHRGNCAEQMAAVILFNEIEDENVKQLPGSRVCFPSSATMDL